MTAPGTPRLLRSINDRTALELFLEHETLTRARLSELSGLSRPTAGQLLVRLQRAGAVMSDGYRTGQRGPQAEMYRLDPSIAYAVGLDVRPGRIVAAVADVTGAIQGRIEVRTGRGAGPVEVTVREAVDAAMAEAGLRRKQLTSVVVGTPGAVDPITGRLAYARHLPGWHEAWLLDGLRQAVGVPVSLVNDVKLAAVAELDARPERDFALLWNGDGLGLAAVAGGQVSTGARGGAGEVGYMPVPGAEPQRNPGRTNSGGYQTTAGAAAVRRVLGTAGFPAREAAVALGRAVSAADLGERQAAAAVDDVARRLAVGLAAICCVLDPPLVVLAGPLCMAGGARLRRAVETELTELTINAPAVALSAVADNSVLRGAVRAAVDRARDVAFARYTT